MSQNNTDFEKREWYLVTEDQAEPQGPIAMRDIDVKFRTGEISSTGVHAWREGMSEWKVIAEIPQIKQVLEDCHQPDQGDLETPVKITRKQSIHDEAEDITQKAALEMIEQTPENNKKSEQESIEKQNGEISKNVDVPEPELTPEELKIKEMKRLKRKRYNENKKKKWFQNKINTYIYVEGLPQTVTHEEISDYFKKCGILKLDIKSGEDSIKIYTDSENQPKGDARIGFAKVESVETAITMLHGSHFSPECTIKVSQAEFTQKGEEYVPRKIQKTDKLTIMKLRNKQEKQLQVGFYEQNSDEENVGIEDLKDTGPKIAIIQNLFTETEIQKENEQFFIDLENDIKDKIEEDINEMNKSKVSIIQKIELFRLNSNGTAKIKFKQSIFAEQCIKLMDQRWFDQRKLNCFLWDGKTDFRKEQESKDVLDARIKEFGNWLDEEKDQNQK